MPFVVCRNAIQAFLQISYLVDLSIFFLLNLLVTHGSFFIERTRETFCMSNIPKFYLTENIYFNIPF